MDFSTVIKNLVMLADIKWYYIIINNIFTISKNTEYDLTLITLLFNTYFKLHTNLVPFGIGTTLSIVGDMRSVSSWKHHNMVLIVLCQSGTITILILAFLRNKSHNLVSTT
jgi:hypothetical protein